MEKWQIEQSTGSMPHCIRFSHLFRTLPRQGWKLHISASTTSAEAVLRRVLPILLDHTANFKIVGSLQQLRQFNLGLGGNGQIGKFITVYPGNDYETLALAVKLDQATHGLSGPNIPSDHVLSSGSLIYYRYGSFDENLLIQFPQGFITGAIYTPKHELISDSCQAYYQVPDWATDPFEVMGIAQRPTEFVHFIHQRYRIKAIISASSRHIVYRATDVVAGCTCVLKGPGYAWQRNPTDKAGSERLQHEARMLTRLATLPQVPIFYTVIEHEHDLFLVTENIEGQTLYLYVSDLTRKGYKVPYEKVIAWSQELATILEKIHAQGLVYAHIDPMNIILPSVGYMRLVDFEFTNEVGTIDPDALEYTFPEQGDKQPLTIYHDIYSFGALLYFMVTGIELTTVPGQASLIKNPLEWLCPDIAPALKIIIARCLEAQPENRYSSMNEVRSALHMASAERLQASNFRESSSVENWVYQDENHYQKLASRLLTTLCAVSEQSPARGSPAWKSAHPIAYGLVTHDINIGNAGVILALAELVSELADSEGHQVLKAGAHRLRAVSGPGPQELAGLYIGKAGVGAALLRAGQVLNDRALIQAAGECGKQLLSLPCTSPDLFNGIAGKLRFHIFLWDETSNQEHLQQAILCGKYLLEMSSVNDRQEVCWTIPSGYGRLSGRTYLGYAHGAAGIADALLDLFEVTGDQGLLPSIQGAARWLMRQALPALEDQSAVNWPRLEGEEVSAALWCHGATGIGRFFLHLAKHNLLTEAWRLACGAARTAARRMPRLNPTQCHGLAGSVELLLDMYQATGNCSYLVEARSLGKLLECFAVERDGLLVFSSEQPEVFTPDYMVGYAGIAVCLLRLSAPERLAHQLSRAGFQPARHVAGFRFS